jgi:hypothetical protein
MATARISRRVCGCGAFPGLGFRAVAQGLGACEGLVSAGGAAPGAGLAGGCWQGAERGEDVWQQDGAGGQAHDQLPAVAHEPGGGAASRR